MVNEIKIGITGASGFIGNSLINYLKKKGLELIVIKSRLNNIENLKREFAILPKLDVVYHLAGTFVGEWDSLYENNFIATKNLLSCLNANNTKVIFSSSGSVYGNTSEFGVNETFKCQPVDNYGKLKFMSEKIIIEYGNYLIFRIPSVYGKGNSKGVIYNWEKSIKSGELLCIGDNGLSFRSFLNVNDLVSVLLLSLRINKSDIYNLAENKSFSMIELARIMSKDKKINFKFFKSNNLLKSMVLKNYKFCKETNFNFSSLIYYLNEN